MTQHNMKKIISDKVQQRGDASFMYLEKDTLQTVLQHLLQSSPPPLVEVQDVATELDRLIAQQQQQFERLLANLSEKEAYSGE
ncbi:hypothetical protein [Bacillus ndiopicus]|uniref:hypothetical protein n=1 Tax=Bacillus ndiopicus TaxID=1347368 RepID=UPI0005A87331|nr:hypothetical protein [Bacillus ndiopicus]